nr:MAG TPA: hypothetical protein [Caudoviricetes sp.]
MNPTPNIDWRKIISDALPSFLRKPMLIALLLAATAPLRALYALVERAIHEDRYRLAHNGQVCSLLGVLEEKYHSSRGIHYRIEDIVPSGHIVDTFSGVRRGSPVAHPNRSPKALHTFTESTNVDRSGFRVYVPRDVYNTRLSDVMWLVEQYKLPTRRAVFLPTDN